MPGNKPYFLKSERVFLRPVEPEDFAFLHRWFNDDAVTQYLFYGQTPKNLEETKKMFEEQVLAGDLLFVVAHRETGDPIGLTGLHEIHASSRSASFRIFIGEEEYRGKGFGTEITELMTYYGFDRLNLHRISLGYTAANEAAGRVYEKAGYVQEGVLRDSIYRNSRYYDSISMAILRNDYYKNYFEIHEKRFGKV